MLKRRHKQQQGKQQSPICCEGQVQLVPSCPALTHRITGSLNKAVLTVSELEIASVIRVHIFLRFWGTRLFACCGWREPAIDFTTRYHVLHPTNCAKMMLDFDSCGLLERKNVALNTWKTQSFELCDNLLSVYEDESKAALVESMIVDPDTVAEVLPAEEHRKYIFSVTRKLRQATPTNSTDDELSPYSGVANSDDSPAEGRDSQANNVTEMVLILSTSSSSLLEMWMIAFIQISRGSFSPSERFSVSSTMAAPLFNTTRNSEIFSPLETEDFAMKSASLSRRIAEIQSVR
jgi:hypothetical protein